MVREDATGTVYYGSTADDDFNEAMGLLQSGGGELNTGTLRIQFGTDSSNNRHYIRVYYTWMDDAHWVVKVQSDSNTALGYTIFISASGDAYAYFTAGYSSLSSPTFAMASPSYMWLSGSTGTDNKSYELGFIKYNNTNIVGTGKTAKSAVAMLRDGSSGEGYIRVYENNRSSGSYSGGKLLTSSSGNSANFTLLGPICDKQSTGVATSAKFAAMNSQGFSAGDYMIGGHRFKHVGSGIFLYGESN